MYGSQKDIRHNLKMFFIDGVSFMPSMALISISAVIPYFLDQLGATTFQVALATSMTLICVFVTQPIFGYIASRTKSMHKTFGKILFLQRFSFLIFLLLIPVMAGADALLINVFLVFWCVYNFFVGSYTVFHTPLLIRLLPPDKRGGIRGIGFAIGSLLGVGMSALIPLILTHVSFPYNYMVIFFLGLLFQFVNAATFFFLRESADIPKTEPMGIAQYIKQMPFSIRESFLFRAMILTCIFLAIANSLLPYYTLYAIRVFSATEANIAVLAGLAIFAGAFAHIVFGYIVDRHGPRIIALIVACLIIAAGVLALTTNSLALLYVAWVLANLCNSGTMLATSLLLGEVSPKAKLPLYVGVYFTISMALSAAIVLILAPVLENTGFALLFVTVLTCGLLSFFVNLFVLRKRMKQDDLI